MLSQLKNKAVPSAVEQRAVLLEGKHVTYTLKRSTKRRSIGLHIDERGLIVSVPMRSSEKWLHSVLQEKARWVVTRLDGWRHGAISEETNWVDGGTIPYLGELLSLRVVPGLFVAPAHRKGNELLVFVENNGSGPADIKDATSCWYRREAEQLFSKRVEYYAPKLSVSPASVKLSSAKTQWGCCTAKGIVLLNLQLVKLPLRLIDYVVVHELAHLREMNHSANFWKVVEMVYPDFAGVRNELKDISL